MKNKKRFGDWGEEVAQNFLEQKGFQILFQKWRAERGEIDLIAREGDCIVFVEVKTGSTELYGPPELRITPRKKRQLYKLALAFLQQSEDLGIEAESYRFDVVVVDGTPANHRIRHYPAAFYL